MSRWRIYEKEMGEQRLLALQIHKHTVSAKGGNCKKMENQGQRRDRKKMRKQESQKNRDRVVLCIICSHNFRLSACIEAWAQIMIGWALKRRIISLDVEACLHSAPLFRPPCSTIRDESELSPNQKECCSFFNAAIPLVQCFKGTL